MQWIDLHWLLVESTRKIIVSTWNRVMASRVSDANLCFRALGREGARSTRRGTARDNEMSEGATVGWGSMSAQTMSAQTDTDTDDLYTTAMVKSTRRKLKRNLERNSPDNIHGTSTNSCEQQASKKANLGDDSNSPLYSAIIQGKTEVKLNREPENINRPSAVNGRATKYLLKAAEKDASSTSIFCVSNVSKTFTEEVIRKHCMSNGVRVRFIFDVTAPHYNLKAFKLAVSEKDYAKIADGDFWPDGVIVHR